MRKLLLLLIAVLSGWEVSAQVTTFMNAYKTPIWMTFANIDHSGDLLYLKSISQPVAGENNFTCVVARFNTKTNTEVATITLLNLPGRAYSATNISFWPAKNGIVCDDAGNLYVSVYSSDKVYRFDGPLPTSGNVTKNISYTYTLPSLSDDKPLALDLSGNLYIGKGTSLYKVPAASLATNALPTLFFNTPSVGINDIDFKDGAVYIAGGSTKLLKYSSKGLLQETIEFAGTGTNIWSAEMATNDLIYYITGNNRAVITYDIQNKSNITFAGLPGTSGSQEDLSTTPPYDKARFNRLINATLGQNGLMFAYDESNSKVYKIVTNATYEPGEPINQPEAPVLTKTELSFASIDEDLVIEQNKGVLISDLISGAVSSAGESEVGIAVIGRDAANGTWQYFQNNLWYTFDQNQAPSTTNSLLLPATAKIRFLPATNFNGKASFSFRAWNQSEGTAYGVGNTSVNGGTTAYSAEQGTASITISAINDVPEIKSVAGVNVLNFDGAKGYVSIPSLNLSGDYTIEAWVYVTQHQTWSRIADIGNGAGRDNLLATFRGGNNDLGMETYVGTQGGHIGTNAVFPTGVWKHVATVNNGTGTGTLYIDGKLITSGSQKIPQDIVRSLNYLGKSNWSGDAYFKGKMREVRIWDVARSQTQIQENINRQLAGNEEGLEVYYKFNEGTGSTLMDASGNNKNGTIQAGASWEVDATSVNSITTQEDIEKIVTGLQVLDPDAGSDIVTLTLKVTNGKLKVKDNVTNGVTNANITNNNSTSVIINAPIAAINETIAKNGFVYVPNANFNGIDNIILSINDNGLTGAGGNQTSALTITVTVEAVNDAPIVTSSPVISAVEGKNYTYTITATDVDVADNLIFSTTVKPEWLIFDNSTGTLNGVPKKVNVGSHSVTMQVTDGKSVINQTFIINVDPLPLAPVILSVLEDTGDNTDAVTSDNTITLFGTAEPGVSIKIVEKDLGNIGIVTSNEAGNWNFAYTTVLPDGNYSFTANATNSTNHSGPFSEVFRVIIDSTEPETTIASGPPASLNNSSATFNFTSNEDIITYQISLDGAAYRATTGVVTLTGLSEGSHELKVYAQDLAGNVDRTPAIKTWTVDVTAPTVTVTTVAQTPINTPFEVRITFSEEVNNFAITDITLNNATASVFTAVSKQIYSALITPVTDGEVRVKVAAAKTQDAATNNNEASNELKVIFDGTSPAGYVAAFKEDMIDYDNQTSATVNISGAESGTTYFYSVTSTNGGTPLTGSGSVTQEQFSIAPLNVTGLADGKLTIVLYLQDAAGNKGAEVTAQVEKLTRNIVAVAQPASVQVPIRTTFLQVPLPVTVEVTYSDNSKQQLAVTWQPGNYNAYANGQYEITGILTLAPGTSNQQNLPAKIIVEVLPNKVPTDLAISNTNFSPSITSTEAIGKFSSVDPDDTEFTYALAAGSGDTHNNLFEVREGQLYLKSNQGLSGQTQFTIRVRTTDPYNNSLEKSFTLTKTAYAKAEEQLKIVNAFSPNGDGVNDEWTVPELKFYNKVSIEVFDRSGVRLFHTTNPEKGWNGQDLHGQVLQGAFLYIIQVEDIKLTKKGVITVLKR